MVDGGHVLLVTYPAQGHVNPALQFAKRLVRMGVNVTFVTSLSARRRMPDASSIPGDLNFTTFSDGHDEGYRHGVDDANNYLNQLRLRGMETLRNIIVSSADQGRPVGCVVYTLLLPWAAEVARDLRVPIALLWIQLAAVLDIYYHYFHCRGDDIRNVFGDRSRSIDLPGLPISLSSRDLPSFVNPSDPYSSTLLTFKEQVDALDAAAAADETKPRVLVNTFEALEPEALKGIERYDLVAVGPLVPSAFLDGRDPSDVSFGGDMFHKSKDYLTWLDSKPKGSVVYVSFGSLLVVSKKQLKELSRGLLETGRPFLWVTRDNKMDGKGEDDDQEVLNLEEKVEGQGLIVPWCSQLEVLSHRSLGCFVSHCGWNSTLESLSVGVPMVAFPHWTDQGTNAKMIEDVWRTGVRVSSNEEGIVEGDEVRRCVELVMEEGEKKEELRRNVRRWKNLARDAVVEGGSSERNLQKFIDQMRVLET